MSVSRILANIVAEAKVVTLDDMDDEVVTYRKFMLHVRVDGEDISVFYKHEMQIPDALVFNSGPECKTYLPYSSIKSITVEWLK